MDVDDFKNTKRELKRKLAVFEENLDKIEETTQFNQLSKVMVKTREIKMQSENLQMQMVKKWEMLAPSDKGHYKQKLTRFKDEYNKLKTRFRKAEDRFNDEENRNKLNNFKAQGVSLLPNFIFCVFIRPKKSLIVTFVKSYLMAPGISTTWTIS